MLPDLSDEAKMVHVGRMSVLMSARRKAAKQLRDRLVPILNSIEMEGNHWDVSGVVDLVEQIQELNKAIAEIN
jgi:hypothetical protein